MDDATRLERTSLVVPADRCELRLDGARLAITKERPAQDVPTTVDVPVSEVRGATLERPSRGQPGWLHIAVVGGTPAPTNDLGSTLDPYTMPITSRNVAAARRVVRLITQHVRQRGLPPEQEPDRGRISSSVTVTGGPAATRPTGAAPAPVPATVPPPVPPPGAPAARAGSTATPPAAASKTSDVGPTADDPPSLARALRELADLHASGALSDEEFEQAKAKVLEAR
jgi:hypothetical protein